MNTMQKTEVELKWFWSSLYTHPMYIRFKEYFMYIFKDVLNSGKYEKIIIYSVFSDDKGPDQEDRRSNKKILHVLYSGEPPKAPHLRDPNLFDLNLIPSLEAKLDNFVIIPHTLGGQHLYIHDLWNLLYYQRDYEKDNTVKDKFCAFIVSNGIPMERKYFFQYVNTAYKKVDSCGPFANNTGFLPPEIDTEEYYNFLSKYKFMICFENTKGNYYFTEKLINAYIGKCIPIYWGCIELPEFINEKALIYIENANDDSFKKALERIIELDNDPVKYREVYEQPLFKMGELPPELNVFYIRNKINSYLLE